MRKMAFLGASALVLALGIASAAAEPFNPSTGYSSYGDRWTNSNLEQYHESGAR